MVKEEWWGRWDTVQGHKKWVKYLLLPTSGERGRKLQLAFINVYYVPNSHHRTSCTVYSSSVLLTPLPFSDYEDKRKHVHERYGKGAVQIPNSNKHLAHSAHTQLSRQALVLLFPPGTANCALPKGTFYIHRHDPRIEIFSCNIQTISCIPGRPLLEAKLEGKEIFRKKRTYLNTLENTEKKTGEAFHSLLIRMTFHPNCQWEVESRENFQSNWIQKKIFHFIAGVTQMIPKYMLSTF